MSVLHLDKEELRKYLIRNGISANDAFLLFDENVDGKDFLSITNDDLKDLGLKLGNRKKLLSIIESENKLNGPSIYAVISMGEGEIISPPIVVPAMLQENDDQFHTCDQAARNSHMLAFKYTKPETIPVLEAVKASAKGNRILKCLEKGEIIAPKDVREIVRSVVALAVKDLQSMYLSYQQKLNLAKAIVMAIPQLKITRDGCKGYEHFFNPHTRVGMIEWRLKTMRLSLSPSMKKYARRRKKQKTIYIKEECHDDDSIL